MNSIDNIFSKYGRGELRNYMHNKINNLKTIKDCKNLMSTLSSSEFNDYDPELSHEWADAIIVEALKILGLSDFAESYDNIHKWFA